MIRSTIAGAVLLVLCAAPPSIAAQDSPHAEADTVRVLRPAAAPGADIRPLAGHPADTIGPADHHMHIQTAELTRIIDAGQRASGGSPKDAPPVSAHTAADAIEALDAAGIQHGLALSGAYIWGSPLLHSPMVTAILDSLGVEIGDERARVRVENEYLSEQIARFPERLVGACSVNPLKNYALEEVELCKGDAHIRAFKVHLFQAGVVFSNTVHVARLRSFFQALGEADLSAIVHLRNRVEGYGAEDAGIFIREVLAAAPDLPVQIAHMAGWGPYDGATDSAMQAFVDAFEDGTLDRSRLTFDVGAFVEDPHELEGDTARMRRATSRNRRLAARMREVGIERVVFGTDWPVFPAEGDAKTRVARAQALLRRVLPLEPDEMDRFFANVGPVFRR